MNINELIGEATEYDKKLMLETKKAKSWCKSVSAFANTLGGALIFGISDQDQFIGLENPNSDAEKISEIIKRHFQRRGNAVLLFRRWRVRGICTYWK